MRQEVKFILLNENNQEIEEIISAVEWESKENFNISFFDRKTGYKIGRSATGAQKGWKFEEPEAQKNIINLIHAIDSWVGWIESISWVDGASDIFKFRYTGKIAESGKIWKVDEVERILP